jgi:hypothetical protein
MHKIYIYKDSLISKGFIGECRMASCYVIGDKRCMFHRYPF